MKSIRFLLIFLLSSWAVQAQELLTSISINTEQLQLDQQRGGSNVYAELQKTMQEFMNGRRWSSDNFSPEEKIKLNINLLLTKSSAQGDIEATARVQVLRPVFGTSYETVLLNFVDRNFNFKYQLGNPITYNDNNYTDNLSSLMAYYAYLGLTYSYDSFGTRGGEPFVQKLNNLTNLAQNSGSGWGVMSDVRSRIGVSENLINQNLQPMRDIYYDYHRLYLDKMTENPDATRKGILEILKQIRQINSIRPGAASIRVFFEAKAEEIISLLDEALPAERQQAFTYLSTLDPIRTEAYRRLIK
ncbi:DUF4835 family protein [Aquirufa sp.]|jgi:hypothetical protein|uniref:type IX secretion system protein PorD n=1 Tax=Aquirufa sp. TaxID=2676249 RepID=UPI0037846823